ncbi:hypothetical protein HDV05_004325 [Chytridiales sp. JEL 0842]|nr:hypothetical protein HDV05_004325 [Chytridiales sp. JEL 0842]
MKISIFGASGAQTTGSQFLRQALEKGHEITVLVRNPDRLSIQSDKIMVITGDVFNPTDVAKAIPEGTEAVVVSLGGAPGSKQPTVCSEGTKNILTSLKSTAPNARLLAVTSMGVNESIHKVNYFVWFFVKTVLASVIPDKNLQEDLIKKESDWLDWVVVRPGGLTNGVRTGVYKLGAELSGGQVSRADVADFLMKNLKDGEWKHRAPSMHY